MARSHLHREDLFYGDDDDYLSGALPFLRRGIEAGEEVMVAVPPAKIELIESALGADAAQIRFADMAAIGRNPARIIPSWRDFVDSAAGAGHRLRAVGEPVWPGRSQAEIDECRRHRGLLDAAFSDGPRWSLLCPYDARHLEPSLLEAARRSPPPAGPAAFSRKRAGSTIGYAFDPFAGRLTRPPPGAERLSFGRGDLSAVRALASRLAGELSFDGERCGDVVAAVNELAGNSIVHGGGRGVVWGWEADRRLRFEVRDAGRIADPLVGRRRPTLKQLHGRGLWMVNQLCDLAQIRSGEGGTSARIHFDVVPGERDPRPRGAGSIGI